MRNTKSLLALILACMMIVSCIVVAPVSATGPEDDPWDEWDGSSDDDSWQTPDGEGVYHITSANQLANFAAELNEGAADNTIASSTNHYQGKTIVLDVNIRLNSESDIADFANWGTSAPALTWTPIGSYDAQQSKWRSFNGTFDGQGHTIEGMYRPTQEHAGMRPALFGIVGELVTIKNLNMTKCYVKGSGNGLGIIAGQMANTHSNRDPQTAFLNITVDNCYFENTGSGGIGAMLGRTAGLVGQEIIFNNCDVTNSTMVCSAYGGGIMGFHGSGDLGSSTSYPSSQGGLTFIDCDLTGNTFKGAQNFGGVLGGTYAFSASTTAAITLRGCHTDNRLIVTSTTAGNQSGGLVGYFQSPPKSIVIDDCSVAGDIDVLQNSGVFVGRIGNSTANADVTITVTDCESTANLTSNVMRDGINSQCLGVVVGLFQSKSGTNIASFVVDGLTCSGTFDGTLKSGNSMGALIGSTSGVTTTVMTISNVTSSVNVLGVGTNIGGLFGNPGPVTNATFLNVNVNATLTGGDGVGGFFGTSRMMNAAFTDCSFTGSASGGQYVGGFIGDVNTTVTEGNVCDYSFTDCYVSANLTGSNREAGGFIGDYDPSGGNTAAGTDNLGGSFTFTNCLYTGDIVATHGVGGLFGRVYPKNTALTIDSVVLLGNRTATDAATPTVTALIGEFGTNYVKDDVISIDNIYYNGEFYKYVEDPEDPENTIRTAASAKLASFAIEEGCSPITECIFYTPADDHTSVVSKQPNAAILNFLEDTKALDFSGVTHTCTPVDIEQETLSSTPSFTLGCEIPGCANHTVTGNVGECIGASIRTGANAGLRFGFRMDETIKVGSGDSVNMGVIVIPTALFTGELTLDTPKIATAKAVNGFSDANPNYLDGTYTFTAVLTGIPETAKDTSISARAYVQIGSTVYYSETVATTYNTVLAALS